MSIEPTEDEFSYEWMMQEMKQRLFDPLPEGLVGLTSLILIGVG